MDRQAIYLAHHFFQPSFSYLIRREHSYQTVNGIRDELEGDCTWHPMLNGTQALGMQLILTMLLTQCDGLDSLL